VGRGANGTVESLEGDTLRLTTAEGEITVTLTDETVLTRTATAERADLQAGARVTVIGERDDSGDLTAAVIQILPDTPQE
jgi:RNase P/RNase MRP subunit p29